MPRLNYGLALDYLKRLDIPIKAPHYTAEERPVRTERRVRFDIKDDPPGLRDGHHRGKRYRTRAPVPRRLHNHAQSGHQEDLNYRRHGTDQQDGNSRQYKRKASHYRTVRKKSRVGGRQVHHHARQDGERKRGYQRKGYRRERVVGHQRSRPKVDRCDGRNDQWHRTGRCGVGQRDWQSHAGYKTSRRQAPRERHCRRKDQSEKSFESKSHRRYEYRDEMEERFNNASKYGNYNIDKLRRDSDDQVCRNISRPGSYYHDAD